MRILSVSTRLERIVLLACCLFAAGTQAASSRAVTGPQPIVQEERAARDPASLWKTAKNRRLPIDERAGALEQLAAGAPETAFAVLQYVEREAARATKALGKAEAQLEKDFGKAARRLLDERVDRAATKAIEVDRALVLRHARSAGLQKETIVAESDPALERLRSLLTVGVEELFGLDADLGEARQAVEDQVFEVGLLRDVFLDAVARLDADAGLARRAAKLDPPLDPLEGERALRARLEFAARLATPMGKSDASVLEANRAAFEATRLDPEEARGIEVGNSIRILLGLRALRFDDRLGRAARGHSRDMVEEEFFAHDSPLEGRETPWKRAALEGTSASAENIAAGQSTGEGAIRAWWHSPGHHRNLLGNHARIGLGRHESHWTQLFGG